MGIADKGRLYSFGWNAYGQCGVPLETTLSIGIPTLVESLIGNRIVGAATGIFHSIALTG